MKKIRAYLCIVIAIFLLVACGNGGGDTPKDEQGGNTQPPSGTPQGETPSVGAGSEGINWDEHVNYSWWLIATIGDFFDSYNGNPVVNYMEERFNVSFDFVQPVIGTESDSLSILMGTGNYTDLISLAVYSGSIPQLYNDGIIIDIAEWLEYMPNLQNLLNTYPDFNRAARDDEGRILVIPMMADESELTWAGLMYRHDILDAMTGGNVQFPSGENRPTTLADWEWMLPLMKEYYETAGFPDFAPLIIPANGIFAFGELMSTFGVYGASFYVRNNEVHHDLTDPRMYDYVSTMRDWYAKGWIHQDFASRTDDLFFMPNPQLVFGGGAGVFYGMMMHLGDRMSIPEYGMFFDVRPISSPKGEGVTDKDIIRRGWDRFSSGAANAIHSGADNIGRLLSTLDHLYSDEGAMLTTIGLNADQITPGRVHDIMSNMGLLDGAYWFDGAGNLVLNPNMQLMGGNVGTVDANGVRLGGYQRFSLINAASSEEALDAHQAWGGHDSVTEVHPLPGALSLTDEESATVSLNNSRMTDHFNQHMAMFIMGTMPLNESTWSEFVNEQRSLGLDENLAIQRAAFARYLARG